MKEVTVRVASQHGTSVFEWCFAHLTRPAYLRTWRIDRGYRIHDYPMIWRRLTNRLAESPFGSSLPPPRREIVMTIRFRDDSDAALFAIAWGSIPITENLEIYSIGNYSEGTVFSSSIYTEASVGQIFTLENVNTL